MAKQCAGPNRIGHDSYYSLGDSRSAEQIRRGAANMSPADGIVFNNLAQVLWEQGREKEASAYALKAVQIGGPLKSEFQKTLEEIQVGNDAEKVWEAEVFTSGLSII